MGGVSPYAGKAESKVAAAEDRVRAAEQRAHEAERKARTADVRATRAEDALSALLARLDVIDEVREPPKPEPQPQPIKMDRKARPEVLHGYAEIGDACDATADQARSWARAGLIPTFKMGRKVCARRSAIRATLAAREAGAMKAFPSAS